MKKQILIFLVLILGSVIVKAQWAALASGTINALYSCYFTDASTGFAVGDNGTIIKTTDGGASWIALTSGTNQNLKSVYFIDNNTGYVSGLSGTILKTTDGGTSWVSQSNPFGVGANLYTLYFTDSNTGFATGYLMGFNKPIILKTTDGGASWVSKPNGLPAFYMDLSLLSVCFPTSNIGYVCGNFGKVYKTTDGGENWTELMTVGASTRLNSIEFIDSNTGFVVGDAGASSTIFKTTDGGVTWTSQISGITETPSWPHFFSIAFLDANIGYTVGYSVGGIGRVFKTVDGGASWDEENPGTSSFLYSAFFPDGITGFAVGSNGAIVKTEDGAVSDKTIENQEKISLYPNPAHDFLNIERENEEETVVEIFNSSGQMVLRNTFVKFVTLHIENFPNGLYVSKLTSGNCTISKYFVKN